jgi:flavorubredoxin
MNPFQAIKLTESVYWVGAIDWEIRNFHGYNTSRGTTYNAYLIMGDEPILVDTVKAPFYDEMLSRIKSIIEPSKIKYIISNHAEMDHSGSLPQTIATIKPEKVFASKMGVKALAEHFNCDLKITEINNGETLNLGNSQLTFLETRMLHWPDSMFTYFANDKFLFTQDGFGMHLATTKLFAEENNRDILHYEASKYFANILLPYANFVTRLLTQFKQMDLKVDIIAPDHGPIWRNNDVNFIIDLWGKWAKQEYYSKAVIIYDTMWNSTAKMARSIADGIYTENVEVKLLPLTTIHRSDVATEILEAGALLIGSPTLNQQIFPTVADVLTYLQGLKPKNLIGQVFGSYGWGGEAIKILTEHMTKLNIEPIGEAINVKYVPTNNDLVTCRNLGINIAKQLKNKIENQNEPTN